MNKQNNLKYPVSDNKPSGIFIDSLDRYGSSSANCNCGRRHYAPSNVYDSDNEEDYNRFLRMVLDEQKDNPDGVIINYENDFIHSTFIDGRKFVIDCPCNGLTRYEHWIWSNKDIIRKYLKSRIEQEYDLAQQQLTLNKLAGI